VKRYRALLHFYPASFRVEYGREMDAIFTRRYQRAPHRAARIALWAEAIIDVLTNAPAIHWDILRQDIRLSRRALWRARLFSVTVILVSAIGIGATTAAFSLADHVLIRPLPFRSPERLVKLWENHAYRGYGRMEVSLPSFAEWKKQSTSFENMAAFTTFASNLLTSSEPVRVDSAGMVGDLFGVLGVAPTLGRGLRENDSEPAAAPVLVLSDRLWRGRFNADPHIIGRSVTLDNQAWTIVGVMPPSFEFPGRNTDCWIAFKFPPAMYEQRNNNFLQVIARLKPGVTIAQAQAELTVIVKRLATQFTDLNPQAAAKVLYLRDELSPQTRQLLWGLVGAAAAVLLIACANLANLFLTRALSRRRELAVRAALGAGRQRLVRQLFTEGLLLAGAGGVAGVALAVAAIPSATRLVPNSLPIAETPPLDWRMLIGAAVATLATAMAFALLPALRFARHADATALREGVQIGTSRRTERLRSALVVAEVTASVALLVCSVLLVRALVKVSATDPGFRAEGVLTLRTALPTTTYAKTERRMQFYNRVLSEIRALPGVTGAAYISFLPMVMRGGIWGVAVDGQPEDPTTKNTVSLRQITPGFFAAMGIPVLHGRDVSDKDTGNTPLVAVVSESFVRRHWPSVDPIGRRVFVAFNDRTVVGVVGDIRVRGLERESEPQLYIPAAQLPDGAMVFYAPKDLVVRSSVPPASLTESIRAIVARADPQQPISEVTTLSEIVGAETAPRRVQVRVLTTFAVIALALACVGLHGVLAYSVSARAREIGVRIALGAERKMILAMVLRRGFALGAFGVVLGGVLSVAAGSAMQALLAGVSPTDVAAFTAMAVLSLIIVVAGSLLPALRAARVDPITVIRSE
jgi:predicted permease